MKRSGKCPKCGCAQIITGAKAIDSGNSQFEMAVAVFRNPGALFFKGKQQSALAAYVCSECGFTEFYAESPAAFKTLKGDLG